MITHDAIKVGDVIYNNLNPEGINYSDWLKDLGIADYPYLDVLYNIKPD